MKRRTWCMSMCVAMLPAAVSAEVAETPVPKIQLALLLDTSNSMDGLINQAKAQLWKIVNEFIPARREGVRPELQVALYEYGNNGLDRETGFIRLVMPLTTDLDKISEELFALRTNGGQEYCGQVIQTAVNNLAWSTSAADLKTIFIAGNEPFTQGPVDYRQACQEAIAKGITVNTIFCGRMEEGIRTNWKDGAVLADGSYMNIDQNQAVVHIAAPQDAEIARLGVELNSTYIAYGAEGRVAAARQSVQDANAHNVAQGSAVQRAVTKASANYRNANWDLVDAVKENQVKLADVKNEDLPEDMRKMIAQERQAHVEAKAQERERLQNQIKQLDAERARYVAKNTQEAFRGPADETLDAALTKVIREQAGKKQFRFE